MQSPTESDNKIPLSDASYAPLSSHDGSSPTDEALVRHRVSELPIGHQLSEVAREEKFHHVGFKQLEAIGSASASLGLISTLVFSLCISNIDDSAPMRTSFVCLATTNSIYTTCYSVLEYYYTQMFIGVERYMENRVGLDADESLDARIELVSKVRAVFSTFNRLRAAARNSMWMGLLCLVASAMAQVNPFTDTIATNMSSSALAGSFFACWLLCVGPGWYLTKAPDFAIQSCVCLAGIFFMYIEDTYVKSGRPSIQVVSCLILASSVIIVPYTVMCFRGPLMHLVAKYVEVY